MFLKSIANHVSHIRTWDTQNTRFIDDQRALEIFGQSGLSKDDLARIWILADIDDHGKLNIDEFHVAMGLIHRTHALGDSVNIIQDLLKHETLAPASADGPTSYRPNRSFTNNTNQGSDPSRDATIYVHADGQSPYKPASWHVNRDTVRASSDVDSPAADLSDMKCALANTVQMLDRVAAADRNRTAEDEALEREMEDLKYRVKRINEDLEYVACPPRTASKDDECCKLERELLELMHVRVPEVERKMTLRDEHKDKEKRGLARDRKQRNKRRYDNGDRERPYSPSAVLPPPTPKAAPPPPKLRKVVPPPKPISQGAPPPVAPIPNPAPPPPPVISEVDPEEEAFRAREEAIRKQREARAERLRQLEREEQGAARVE
ncbi:hypothetical protein B0H17DRAFT_1212006 [Mycena rosella]|uniref:Actin cytoskeleton-regulatory complex protein pan1 n=1 Tax=Mycena rosella TaxID=1033263 RepID=A0AAD7CTL5_MYCRO|nr:hypothetical protein B0H17DRAFT_1212006 [Mycena rosella]